MPVMKFKVGDKVKITPNARNKNLVGHTREIVDVFPVAATPYRVNFCPTLFREDELVLIEKAPEPKLIIPTVVEVAPFVPAKLSFIDAVGE